MRDYQKTLDGHITQPVSQEDEERQCSLRPFFSRNTFWHQRHTQGSGTVFLSVCVEKHRTVKVSSVFLCFVVDTIWITVGVCILAPWLKSICTCAPIKDSLLLWPWINSNKTHCLVCVHANSTGGLCKLCTPVVTKEQNQNYKALQCGGFALNIFQLQLKSKTQQGFSCCHNLPKKIWNYIKDALDLLKSVESLLNMTEISQDPLSLRCLR